MLEYLRIRDLALIEDMELEFAPSMNVLTGETGAGKSFILKAINFLLGDKLGVEMVRPGREKAQVEALFAQKNGDLILRRELVAETGRSRFFLNNELQTQDAMRALRPSLLLHAGQHGQQKLLQPSFQAELIDKTMDAPDILEEKDTAFKELKSIAEQKNALLAKQASLLEKREFLEMQQKEIDKVAPQEGEEERLEEARQAMRGSARVKELYATGFTLLADEHGLTSQLAQLSRIIAQLADLESEGEENSWIAETEAVESFHETLRDLQSRFRKIPASSSKELGDADAIEARLYALAQLKRKLKRTLPEILALKSTIDENLSFLDMCALEVTQLSRKEEEAANRLHLALDALNAKRETAAVVFCQTLMAELAGLGFAEEVRVIPEWTDHELYPTCGATPTCIEKRARLLWAPNPGQTPQPLDKIASGGELSRFLLAVIGVQAEHTSDEAILIFDEVDAGVGGITLNRVAERLERLAQTRQMLLITHWPQLASRAKSHFFVRKTIVDGETFTLCTKLSSEEREKELSRMAGVEE